MRPASLLAAAAMTGATLVAVVPAADAATPVVQITRVSYDSPGADLRSNTSLNAEYVTLKNTTKSAINLEKWVLRDASGYKYRFLKFVLKPGKQVTVRSGKGTDTTTTVYWNRGQYVWNNPGDTAGVYRGSDLKKIDTCSWKGIGSGHTTC
jgi:P pilus assembly chaperone PapD